LYKAQQETKYINITRALRIGYISFNLR